MLESGFPSLRALGHVREPLSGWGKRQPRRIGPRSPIVGQHRYLNPQALAFESSRVGNCTHYYSVIGGVLLDQL